MTISGLKYDLSTKTVVITGGSGLLGQSFCNTLLENGANVVILDNNKTELKKIIKKFKNKFNQNSVLGIECDVTNENDVINAVDLTVSNYKKIDVLINNAATKTKNLDNFFKDYENYDLEVWNEIMSVNINSMFITTKIIGKKMISQKIKGSIIQVSSIYGLVGPDQRIYKGSFYKKQSINTPGVYSVSKAAVIGLSKYLATYWGNKGIRVNTLIPGGVESGQNKTFKKKYSYRVPLNRMAKKEDMSNAILFLASDASSYITGQNLVVDGGLSCW